MSQKWDVLKKPWTEPGRKIFLISHWDGGLFYHLQNCPYICQVRPRLFAHCLELVEQVGSLWQFKISRWLLLAGLQFSLQAAYFKSQSRLFGTGFQTVSPLQFPNLVALSKERGFSISKGGSSVT